MGVVVIAGNKINWGTTNHEKIDIRSYRRREI